jgi:hypothetical protein
MSAEERYSRNPNVVYRLIAGERLLVPVRGEAARARRLYTLNALGVSIWELLEKEPTFDGLCSELEKRYPDIGQERIRSETGAFLSDLVKFGLIFQGKGNH